MQCPVCQAPIKTVPAGFSQKTGKPYSAFQTCSNRACTYKPPAGNPANYGQAPQGQPYAGQPPKQQIKKEMLISYEKDILVSACGLVVSERESGINPTDTATRAKQIFNDLLQEFRVTTINRYFKGTFPPPEPEPEDPFVTPPMIPANNDEEVQF